MSNLSKATISVEKYRTLIETDDHHFIVDEPLDLGGGDLGPNPGELLSAALAACTTITIKMYAERKEWKLDEVKVEVDYKRDSETNTTKFTKKVEIIGDLKEEEIQRLYEISARCPIHRTLENPIKIESELI